MDEPASELARAYQQLWGKRPSGNLSTEAAKWGELQAIVRSNEHFALRASFPDAIAAYCLKVCEAKFKTLPLTAPPAPNKPFEEILAWCSTNGRLQYPKWQEGVKQGKIPTNFSEQVRRFFANLREIYVGHSPQVIEAKDWPWLTSVFVVVAARRPSAPGVPVT